MPAPTDDNVVKLYDPANGVYGENVEASQPIRRPTYLSIDGMDDTSGFVVEARLHPDADWQEIDTIDTTAAATLIQMDNSPNFVRVRRTSGENDVVIYAQR